MSHGASLLSESGFSRLMNVQDASGQSVQLITDFMIAALILKQVYIPKTVHFSANTLLRTFLLIINEVVLKK
jgi:hypothetical protein